MNILDVMTKQDLMKAPEIRDGRNYGGYNLTAYFIRTHGKAMGRFAGRWSREMVEAYLSALFGQAAREREAKEYRDKQVQADVDSAIAYARRATAAVPLQIGRPLGKGGRKRTGIMPGQG